MDFVCSCHFAHSTTTGRGSIEQEAASSVNRIAQTLADTIAAIAAVSGASVAVAAAAATIIMKPTEVHIVAVSLGRMVT